MAKLLITVLQEAPGLQFTEILFLDWKKKKEDDVQTLVTHPKSFCYQHSRRCYVVVHDASVFQALYGIDQIHGHNKNSIQVENNLFVFQIFAQWCAFREVVTQ